MCRTDLPDLVGMGAVVSYTFPGWRACGGLGRPWSRRRVCLGLWPSYLIWLPEGVLGPVALIPQGIPHPLATSPGPSLSVAKAKEDVLPKANLARPRTAQSSYSITKGNAASSGALVMALVLRVGNGHHIDLGRSFSSGYGMIEVRISELDYYFGLFLRQGEHRLVQRFSPALRGARHSRHGMSKMFHFGDLHLDCALFPRLRSLVG